MVEIVGVVFAGVDIDGIAVLLQLITYITQSLSTFFSTVE